MTQDEGRFGRLNPTKRAWSPPEARPVVPQQVVRQYLYAFVAVAPALGMMTALLLPWANTQMMALFLAQVAEDFREYFVIMLTDGAGWHTSGDLLVPENIRLIKLPPRSPELNPTEHIWDEVREKYFHNEIFDSMDAVESRLMDGLRELGQDQARIRSMTHFPYLRELTC
ncbi:MAG: transposase [Magnetococcales bacterium]|nr:transposase [Magnetococcales bacterium]